MSLLRRFVLAVCLTIVSLTIALSTSAQQPPDPPEARLVNLDGLTDAQVVDVYFNKPWLLPGTISPEDWARIDALVRPEPPQQEQQQ